MQENYILVPVLIQVILTLSIYIRLGQVKEKAVKDGEVDASRRPLHEDAWPDSVLQVNNNIRNQFETPVLFYILCISLWLTNGVTALALALAGIYAGVRIAHAYVHLGTNEIRLRKRLFQLSVVLLFALCGILFIAIL